jgi:tetratricopeptide (TPR) repeat protein
MLACFLVHPPAAAAQQAEAVAIRESRAVSHAERLERAGREEEALAVLEDLLREQPTSLSALVLASRISERRGEPGRVLPWAERAVIEDPFGLPAARQVWIRALWGAGLRDSATAVARRWVEASPDEQAAYAELAALRAREGQMAAAIRVLEEGRESLRSYKAFVQELADLYVRTGGYARAAKEWRTMLAWGDPGTEAVLRRLQEPDTDRSRGVEELRVELREDATVSEIKGGVDLALRLGEFEWARHLVESLLTSLPRRDGAEELERYLEQARASGDLAGAAWAARRLSERSASRDRAGYWTAMAADLAYSAGDVEAARHSFESVLKASVPGSDAHRLSLQRLHHLSVERDPRKAEELLADYRLVYPSDRDATGRMAVETGHAWLEVDSLARARRVLEAETPVDAEQAATRASVLGRFEILKGRPGAALAHFELSAAVPASDPEVRLRSLRWVSIIARADSLAMARLGGGMRSIASGDPRPITELAGEWSTGRVDGGASLTAVAAGELEAAGFVDEAGDLRSTLVRTWPESPEAPEAMLALARAAENGDPELALAWLERLVVEYPGSALAPLARREMAELRGRVPGA